MATIHFFGKPDCKNNNKQKHLLRISGHEVVEYDITRHVFTAELLRSFFKDMPVADWFNYTAPAIKNGVIDPRRLNEADALQAMLADRLLIRRPLLQIDSDRYCGFDREQINDRIGLDAIPGEESAFSVLMHDDLITCPNLNRKNCSSA